MRTGPHRMPPDDDAAIIDARGIGYGGSKLHIAEGSVLPHKADERQGTRRLGYPNPNQRSKAIDAEKIGQLRPGIVKRDSLASRAYEAVESIETVVLETSNHHTGCVAFGRNERGVSVQAGDLAAAAERAVGKSDKGARTDFRMRGILVKAYDVSKTVDALREKNVARSG